MVAAVFLLLCVGRTFSSSDFVSVVLRNELSSDCDVCSRISEAELGSWWETESNRFDAILE
jgi:hypothetical protein